MSTASKIILLSTGVGTVGLIVFVHWQQENTIEQMHEGVSKDIERRRLKKLMQEQDLQVPNNSRRCHINDMYLHDTAPIPRLKSTVLL